MGTDTDTTTRKALSINLDESRYGTFAEIGAGQEVARHFFVAGHASKTVAKTMSAYDMTFSDAIYGKGKRYVSQDRLEKMLHHEYKLLNERLQEKRGKDSCFFAFADTVATSSHQDTNYCHGWMGVRFQAQPDGPINNVVLHVRMRDRNRLQQQEALGVLGVNLAFSCFYLTDNANGFISSLTENLAADRVEIDMIQASGPDVAHLDNRMLCLELVSQGLTNATIFNSEGKVVQPSDTLYGKPILLLRGTFRPLTTVNLEILEKGISQLKNSLEDSNTEPTVLFEMNLSSAKTENGEVDFQDLIDRAETIATTGNNVMISRFKLFYPLKEYLRRCTDRAIALLIGASHLEKLFNEEYYGELDGGILKAFGRLFDLHTRLLVFPYKSDLLCTTADTFHPQAHLVPLYKYLLENKWITDIFDCDDVDTTIHSKDVREALASGDTKWEKLVPEKVCELIKEKKMFGYKA